MDGRKIINISNLCMLCKLVCTCLIDFCRTPSPHLLVGPWVWLYFIQFRSQSVSFLGWRTLVRLSRRARWAIAGSELLPVHPERNFVKGKQFISRFSFWNTFQNILNRFRPKKFNPKNFDFAIFSSFWPKNTFLRFFGSNFFFQIFFTII